MMMGKLTINTLEDAIDKKEVFIAFLMQRYSYLDHDKADDIFSEVMYKLVKRSPKELSATYISSALLHFCIDLHRKKDIIAFFTDDLSTVERMEQGKFLVERIEQIEEAIIAHSVLRKHIYNLKDIYRNVLILRMRFKMDTKSISEFLDIPHSTARVYASRAIMQLRKQFKSIE